MGKTTNTYYVFEHTRNPDPNEAPTALFKTLYRNALALLANPPVPLPSPTVQDLTYVLDRVARERFQANYGYTFQGAVSKPTTLGIKNLSALDALLNISNASDTQISDYVNLLLNGVNLTSRPVLDSARAHIVEQGRLLSRTPIDNSWRALPFDRSYSDPEPGRNPWKAELMIVQCNAGLTINGHSARYTFIYFVGVYFEIISSDALKVKLFKTLQTNANKLSGSGADPVFPSIQTLEQSLLVATKARFLQTYGIPFNGNFTKPQDLLDSKSGSVRGTNNLYYIQGEDTPDLAEFTRTNILSAIDFGRGEVNFAQENAISGLRDQLTELLKNDTGSGWFQVAFDRIYPSKSLGADALRTISTTTYTNASVNDGTTTLKMKLFLYMGVYYHVLSPRNSIIKALIHRLYQSVGYLYDPPKIFPPPYTTSGLSIILINYSKSKFEEIFDFKYQGAGTKPPDMIHPSVKGVPVLQSYADTLTIEDHQWGNLDDVMFPIMSGLDIPDWVEEPARRYLASAFRSAKVVSLEGDWASAKHTRRYQNKISNEGYQWKTCSILTYCHTSLTEGDISRTLVFISYVAVFYPIASMAQTAMLIEPSALELEELEEEGQFVVL